jgi:predicted AAA+ superfamily ATPase
MIGRPIVVNNLVNTIKSAGGSTSYETINKYIDALREAFVIYSVEMYDVKGRKKLTASKRYYIVDTGLRNIRVNPSAKNMGSLLENIVYLELIRRGYRVYAGSIDGYEIDFIAEKPGEKIYVQVSMSILDESTKERELGPLNLIKDNYPKYILTLDDYDLSENGIIHENIIDFLL